MPSVTSSRDRSKRRSNKPVTKGQNPQRANRQAVSQAKVTSASNGKPTGAAASRVTTGRGQSSKSSDAKSWQKMNQLGSAKSAKAAEPKPRTPAPGTGNVLKAAQQFSKDKAAKDRQVNRGVAAFRAKMNQSMVGKAAALVGGAKALGPKAIAETVAPRPTADGTLTAAMKRGDYKPRQGPAVPQRLTQGGMDKGSFDKAFKASRTAGKKTFTWRGKKYTTKMK